MMIIVEDFYKNFFEVISDAANRRESLGYIYSKNKNKNKKNVALFFEEMFKEIDIESDPYFDRYKKYIQLINEKFQDNFETKGGKSYRYYHTKLVVSLAKKIADALLLSDYDKNIIILAALFHDIGKSDDMFRDVAESSFKEIETKMEVTHEVLSADEVITILSADFDEDTVNKIADTITDDDKKTIYSQVMHEADDMAELGRMGIYRIFYYNSFNNKTLMDTKEYWINVHRERKMRKVNRATLEVSKNMMNERFKYMDDFMKRI